MSKKQDIILVTKPYLPEFSEYETYLKKVWKNQWLTNNGPLVNELEEKLKKRFGVKHLFFVSNGTIALQIALKALDINKEVITTPFSYIASTTAILWENCIPVFADIQKMNFSIDPAEIEKKITKRTQAILAVHVYGYPCDVEKIEFIAKKHKLKVIYDGAHAFDTQVNGTSVLNYGDVSTLSFHATKLFHTVEGGAIITNDDAVAKKIGLYRSFGHVQDEYYTFGINGKNSEFHAAMGLVNLENIDKITEKRALISEFYNRQFLGTNIYRPLFHGNMKYNYAYYPIVLTSEKVLIKVKKALEAQGIFPRRYFYPSINTIEYINGDACPVSESIARRVLCLPLYHELKLSQAKKIAEIVLDVLKEKEERSRRYRDTALRI